MTNRLKDLQRSVLDKLTPRTVIWLTVVTGLLAAGVAIGLLLIGGHGNIRNTALDYCISRKLPSIAATNPDMAIRDFYQGERQNPTVPCMADANRNATVYLFDLLFVGMCVVPTALLALHVGIWGLRQRKRQQDYNFLVKRRDGLLLAGVLVAVLISIMLVVSVVTPPAS